MKRILISFLVLFVLAMAAQAVDVYPTGLATIDVQAVQDAVNLGGTVILKAHKEGAPTEYTAFNFGLPVTPKGNAGFVICNNSVIIQGESAPAGTEFTADGGISVVSDRTVIYGGGDMVPMVNPKGAINMHVPEYFEVSNACFVKSGWTAISVKACDGAKISNNIVKDMVPLHILYDMVPFLNWSEGICISEFWSYNSENPAFFIAGPVKGNIEVKENDITSSPESILGGDISILDVNQENVNVVIGGEEESDKNTLRGIAGVSLIGGEPGKLYVQVINNDFIYNRDNGMVYEDGHSSAPPESLVKNNRFYLDNPAYGAGIWLNYGASNSQFVANKMTGTADYGYRLDSASANNTFIIYEGQIENLNAAEAHVYCGHDTHDNKFKFFDVKRGDVRITDRGKDNDNEFEWTTK